MGIRLRTLHFDILRRKTRGRLEKVLELRRTLKNYPEI